MDSLIEAEELTFYYGSSPSEGEGPLFENISFSLEHGEALLLSGPSGAGKTTFLRTIARLEEKKHGLLRMAGRDIDQWEVTDWRKKISYVPQTPVMFDGDLRQNCGIGISQPLGDELLLPLMEQFALPFSLINQPAATLSVGQRSRVSVIRHLLLKPSVLLLDEPTAPLDPDTAEQFITTIRSLRDDGLAIIWSCHDLDRVADETCQIMSFPHEATR